jgi:hypothetical protein
VHSVKYTWYAESIGSDKPRHTLLNLFIYLFEVKVRELKNRITRPLASDRIKVEFNRS